MNVAAARKEGNVIYNYGCLTKLNKVGIFALSIDLISAKVLSSELSEYSFV